MTPPNRWRMHLASFDPLYELIGQAAITLTRYPASAMTASIFSRPRLRGPRDMPVPHTVYDPKFQAGKGDAWHEAIVCPRKPV